MPAFCYLLECGNGSYYCGWTNDLDRRIKQHKSGNGGRYTRANLPVELVYFEELEDKPAAMKREAQIKRLPHDKKRRMAEGFSNEHA